MAPTGVTRQHLREWQQRSLVGRHCEWPGLPLGPNPLRRLVQLQAAYDVPLIRFEASGAARQIALHVVERIYGRDAWGAERLPWLPHALRVRARYRGARAAPAAGRLDAPPTRRCAMGGELCRPAWRLQSHRPAAAAAAARATPQLFVEVPQFKDRSDDSRRDWLQVSGFEPLEDAARSEFACANARRTLLRCLCRGGPLGAGVGVARSLPGGRARPGDGAHRRSRARRRHCAQPRRAAA
jgi:hypothetical protein